MHSIICDSLLHHCHRDLLKPVRAYFLSASSGVYDGQRREQKRIRHQLRWGLLLTRDETSYIINNSSQIIEEEKREVRGTIGS